MSLLMVSTNIPGRVYKLGSGGKCLAHASNMDLDTDTIHQVVYSLTDYRCNGTTSTVVNSSMRLFDGSFTNGFKIEANFDNMTDSGTGDYRRIFSCESNTSPYPGLNLTRKKGNNDTAILSLSNTNRVETEFQLLPEHNTVSVKYFAKSGEVVLVANGITIRDTVTPLPEFAAYFTIGGQMWVGGTTIAGDRCAAVKINSLKVYKF